MVDRCSIKICMYACMHIFCTLMYENSWKSIGLFRGKRTLSIFDRLWAYFFHFPVSFLKNWFMANSVCVERGRGRGMGRKKTYQVSHCVAIFLGVRSEGGVWFGWPYIFPLKALSHRQPQPKLLNNQAYRSVFNNPLAPLHIQSGDCYCFKPFSLWDIFLSASPESRVPNPVSREGDLAGCFTLTDKLLNCCYVLFSQNFLPQDKMSRQLKRMYMYLGQKRSTMPAASHQEKLLIFAHFKWK